MALKKNPKVDLKRKYKRVFELGMIGSLSLLIFAFKFFPNIENTFEAPVDLQDIITLEDVAATNQNTTPPPAPPQPKLVLQDPGLDNFDDIILENTEIDMNKNITSKPPVYVDKKKDNEAVPEFFLSVEESPSPIGGIAGIQKRIKYPELAKRAGIQGKVYVFAYVDENGDVVKTELAKGIGGGCDDVALEAVKNTKFNPGKQRGKPVKVKVALPVIFKLQ